jgi:hypothetical protein
VKYQIMLSAPDRVSARTGAAAGVSFTSRLPDCQSVHEVGLRADFERP